MFWEELWLVCEVCDSEFLSHSRKKLGLYPDSVNLFSLISLPSWPRTNPHMSLWNFAHCSFRLDSQRSKAGLQKWSHKPPKSRLEGSDVGTHLTLKARGNSRTIIAAQRFAYCFHKHKLFCIDFQITEGYTAIGTYFDPGFQWWRVEKDVLELSETKCPHN